MGEAALQLKPLKIGPLTAEYPVIQGGMLIMAVTSGFVNLAIDIIYGFVGRRDRDHFHGPDRL